MRATAGREFIAGLGGAAVWPLAAHAQQAERMRCIGVPMGFEEVQPRQRTRWTGATLTEARHNAPDAFT
jgi:hypothetical protein